jgi:hypothetical protein
MAKQDPTTAIPWSYPAASSQSYIELRTYLRTWESTRRKWTTHTTIFYATHKVFGYWKQMRGRYDDWRVPDSVHGRSRIANAQLAYQQR